MADKFLTIDSRRVSANLTRALAQVGPMRRAIMSRMAGAMLEAETPVTPLGPPTPGLLRSALYAEVNETGDTIATGTRGVDYAAAVHEGVHPPKDARRGDTINYTTPGTGWKFIENPVTDLTEREMLKTFVEEFLPGVLRK